MFPSPHAVPPPAMTCPRCGGPASPASAPQTCGHCKRSFALYAGAALEWRALPAPGPRLVRVRYADLFTHRFGVLDPHGVAEGTNDPIVAMIPIEQSGVAYQDILTITVWRTLAWGQLVGTVIGLVPLTLLLLYAAVDAPGFLIGALPFAALTAFLLYRATAIGRCRARVVGRYRTIEVRFDQPMWRRRLFHDELLRRAGIGEAAIP